jgi:hypothetical protein
MLLRCRNEPIRHRGTLQYQMLLGQPCAAARVQETTHVFAQCLSAWRRCWPVVRSLVSMVFIWVSSIYGVILDAQSVLRVL